MLVQLVYGLSSLALRIECSRLATVAETMQSFTGEGSALPLLAGH